MTICFSELPIETQRDIAETLSHCFPTMNERQRLYQIANIYIPFHSIVDPIDIWLYVFQSIQKNHQKTYALIDSAHFLLMGKYQDIERELTNAVNTKNKIHNNSAAETTEDKVHIEKLVKHIELQEALLRQISEDISLLQEISIILDFPIIPSHEEYSLGDKQDLKYPLVKNKKYNDIAQNHSNKNRFLHIFDFISSTRSSKNNTRLSDHFVYSVAALGLLSIGLSYVISSQTTNPIDASGVMYTNGSDKQLTNINVNGSMKRNTNKIFPSDTSSTKSLTKSDSKEFTSMSSKTLGSNAYESPTGIIIKNAKPENSTPENSTLEHILPEQSQIYDSGVLNEDLSLSNVSLSNESQQDFKDPLAAALSKATDRLIAQHQRTQNPELEESQSNTSTTASVHNLQSQNKTVVTSSVSNTSKQNKPSTDISANNKLSTMTTKQISTCQKNDQGILYGYWWVGSISSEEERFKSGQSIFIGNWSNVRTSPSSKTSKVCILQPGQQITLKEDAKIIGNNQWIAVYSDNIR